MTIPFGSIIFKKKKCKVFDYAALEWRLCPEAPPPKKYRNIYFKCTGNFQYFYISKHLQEVYRCHQFHHRLRARHQPAPVQCRFPSFWSRRDSTCCRSPKPWSQTTLLVQKNLQAEGIDESFSTFLFQTLPNSFFRNYHNELCD